MGDTKRSEGFPHATTTKLDIVIVSSVPARVRKIKQYYVIIIPGVSDVLIDRSVVGRSCDCSCSQAPSTTACS